MKKLEILFLGLLLLPAFAFAAFNDVTLNTDTVISVGGYTLNLTGSSAVIQSVVLNDSNFSVTLSSGSSIQITSPTYQQLSVDVGTFTTSNNCADNTSILTLSSSGASGTVTITPQATICSTPAPSGSSGGGGGGGFSPPSPITPNGGFTATASTSNSQNKIILHFGFGSDITNIAISDNANFTPASYINATSSVEWTVPTTKILYVKYCNRYGRCSNPISVQISTSALVPIVSNSYKFYKNLSYRMTNSDVKELQKYLNTHGFIIAQSGVGSIGKETNYFGLLTKTALVKFQESHATEILVPSGLKKGTGYFGPSTRAFVNK